MFASVVADGIAHQQLVNKAYPMANPLDDLDVRIKLMRENMNTMANFSPWGREMGFKLTRIEEGHVWARQPYDKSLAGDEATGIIHGGVVTTMLDNLCGAACGAALPEFRFVATLDLRIDYMRPATPGEDILAEAEVYHFTKTICFCRASAYHEDTSRMIATAQGAFAINKPRPTGAQTA